MRRTVRIVLSGALALAALVGAAAPASASASVSDATFGRRVFRAAKIAMVKQAARRATPGLVAYRNGRWVFSRNPDRPLVPASLQKLLVTTAAVLRFGPDRRFETKVVSSEPVAGIVAGDLTVVGAGDPTLATQAFASRDFLRDGPSGKVRVFPNGSPTIESLADAIVGANVARIEGDLVGDESLFDSDRWQQGWQSSYQRGQIDIGNLSALPSNKGLAGDAGRAVAISPAIATMTRLRAALVARGVEISGTVRLGRAPEGAAQIAAVSSPPLEQIVAWTNRWSVNYSAEMLLKALGARFGGAGTTVAGAAVVSATLKDRGIDVSGLRIYDGSGLSLFNRVKPRTIAQTLRLMSTLGGEHGTALRESMAVAGSPGTLLRRMTDSPTGGNLRGKTGLLRGVRALAGWVRSKDGSLVVYVALFNGVRRTGAMTGVLDGYGRSLALLPG